MEIDLKALLQGAPELVIFLVLGLGYWLGRIRIGPLRIGPVPGVLVAGLGLGALGLEIEAPTATMQLGFILFIYSVGFQAGPRFFSLVLRDGKRYLALVVFTAAVAVWTLLLLTRALDLSSPLSAGVLAGSLTSTPTLAAAQDAVRSGLVAIPAGTTRAALSQQVAVGYAISYLFGMLGLLLMVRGLPLLLRVDLVAQAAQLSRHMRIPDDDEEEGVVRIRAKWHPLARTYQVPDGELAGRTLRELALPTRMGCMVQRIKRGGELLDAGPETRLEAGDRILIMGAVASHQAMAAVAGSPVMDSTLLEQPIELREIVVTSPEAAGQTLRELDLIHRYGCFLVGVSRAQLELPVGPDLRIEKSDTVYAYGTKAGLDKLEARLGHVEGKVYETDLLTFAFGIAVGLLIGMIRVKVGDFSYGLGAAGGLLLSGIAVGFLRSVNPTFGRVPRAARWVFMELGLMLFMAGVGLRAGPEFFATLGDTGPAMVLVAVLVLSVPFAAAWIFGLYVLRMNPALLLGALCGALTSTPALGLVSQMARSSVPSLGYAGTYAMANIVLAFAGAFVVRL